MNWKRHRKFLLVVALLCYVGFFLAIPWITRWILAHWRFAGPQKQIFITDVNCIPGSPGTLYVTIRNLDPELSLSTSELLIKVDGITLTSNPVWTDVNGNHVTSVLPTSRAIGIITCPSGKDSCTAGTVHLVKVIGPSNTNDVQVDC